MYSSIFLHNISYKFSDWSPPTQFVNVSVDWYIVYTGILVYISDCNNICFILENIVHYIWQNIFNFLYICLQCFEALQCLKCIPKTTFFLQYWNVCRLFLMILWMTYFLKILFSLLTNCQMITNIHKRYNTFRCPRISAGVTKHTSTQCPLSK